MIIAVDFDGILCENDFPDIGMPNYGVISLVRQLIDKGHEVVLWTTRNGKELENAVKWCNDYGLHFCAVNEPAPSNYEKYKDLYETQSRKIFADVYIDDHNIGFKGRNGYSAIGLLEEQLKGGLKEWETEEN